MPLPIVAIVGRPNVGKSTLANRITCRDDAIVSEMRGVTRDRSYHEADWNGRGFLLVDTGGIALGDTDDFQSSITSQALMAADEADAVIFVVDSRTGPTDEDVEIARVLRRGSAPVLLAVNKLDNPEREEAMWEFLSLGLGEPWAVSALHGHGTGDLLDEVVSNFPEPADGDDADDGRVGVAIIGRPNAGKSTLANRLVGSERSIVSDVAGTTRDAIDTLVDHDGKSYRIVDTAGLRKKSAIDCDVEYYGYVRSLRAIDRADVVLLLVDASLGLTDQDQRIARLAADRGRAMGIVVNKTDLLDGDDARTELLSRIEDRMEFVSFAPVIEMSALFGKGVSRVWKTVDSCYAAWMRRLSTAQLNRLVTELRDFGHGVTKGGRRLRVNYATQTAVAPPVFTFFCNFPELADDNYRRYLENRLRAAFDLAGTPVRLKFKKKN